jgi:hypothetical protein
MVLMAAAVPAGVVGEINDTVVIAAVGTTVKVDREPTGIDAAALTRRTEALRAASR